MPAPIRVVLAEDHTLLRALLRATLSAHPGLSVVGEAATGSEAVRLVRAVQPDVLVLNIELAGGQDGVEVTSRVTGGACRVLAYSSYDDPVHVTHLLQAGASGYLSKGAPIHRVAEAVRAVAAGESRWFAAGLGGTPRPPAGEMDALRHFASGGRPGTLAQGLGVSAEAALGLLAGLYATLGATSWYDALARGWALGLVGPGAPVARVERGYSVRANVPGQANAASVGSYGA